MAINLKGFITKPIMKKTKKTVIEQCIFARKTSDGRYMCDLRNDEPSQITFFNGPCSCYCDYKDNDSMRHCPCYTRSCKIKEDLILNKISAVFLVFIGALSVPIAEDSTFFVLALIAGIALFSSRTNMFDWR